jgi:cysteine desulfurase
MSMETVYLDYNSTTAIDRRVAEAISEAYRAGYFNPASQHRPGQTARRALEEHRAGCVRLLGGITSGMKATRLVFTGGGTEANNLILAGFAARQPDRQVLVSAGEHPSVLGAAEHLRKTGVHVELIPLDSSGRVQLDALARLLERPTSLVSVMLANNETGVIQPLEKVVEICRVHSVPVHTDAVQAVGKIAVDFSGLGVDALTFTPHKFYGPRGIGGLLVKADHSLEPLHFGGFQQAGWRPGTEDVALAAGCRLALQLAVDELAARTVHLGDCSERFLALLREQVTGDFVINGLEAARLPNTLNLAFPGVDRQALLLAADFAGLAISTGSACASGSSEPSPVLLAMGLPKELVDSSVRISFGTPTTLGEVEVAATRLSRLVNELR